MREYEYICDGDYNSLSELEEIHSADISDRHTEIRIRISIMYENKGNAQLDLKLRERMVDECSFDWYDETKELGMLYCI